MKRIRTATTRDLANFLALAESESWRVPQVEREMFRQDWKPWAYALIHDGLFCGFVTAVMHQRSGWIGNLVVPRDKRGKGYGTLLFEAALAALEAQEATTIWLTASTAGAPLYRRFGFRDIDRIERWTLSRRLPGNPGFSKSSGPVEELHRADRENWGEERSALLGALVKRGKVVASGAAVTLLQQEAGQQIIGPWYAPVNCARDNQLLLGKLLACADPTREVVIDLLTSSTLGPLLTEHGFCRTGENGLMVRGDISGVRLSRMHSLASLGSIG